MFLQILDQVVEATRSGRITWRRVAPERYESSSLQGISIEFHYPQVGGETTTGADIVVVSLGGVATSFFNGSEGMKKVREILRLAFPDWQQHQIEIEGKLDDFVKKIQQV